ncbi:MAG: FAD-binding oxidoreductase [Anaerolineae bacterium]|nr:FAD-binding oxidoreductase [Anaerolineae bacterium]
MTEAADVVICGAGIAGVSTAYHLAVKHSVSNVVLVDERAPLSLTSDKSTEAYRNWWPGPGNAMVGMMNRSIDLLEELADECGNAFHMNRRGYLYATADAEGGDRLEKFAKEASELGAGPVRIHRENAGTGNYAPAAADGFFDQPDGADLIQNQTLVREHFPYLSDEIVAVLHVRCAGWLSAQQYGTFLLEQGRKHGIRVITGKVASVKVEGGNVTGMQLAGGETISSPIFVNAAGPMLREVGKLMDVDIPVYNELHLKAAFDDPLGVISRDAPMVIFADQQTLDWTNDERAILAADEDTRWLTEPLPLGAHTRPEGGSGAQTLLVLWDVHEEAVKAVFPPDIDPMYFEIALRGLCKMIPGMQIYLDKIPKPYIDGGYYTKTRESRPLSSPLPVGGAYVIGAMSGYGIMASAALGELLAAHITQSELPSYAPAFDLNRYEDPDYQNLMENWGETWQL